LFGLISQEASFKALSPDVNLTNKLLLVSIYLRASFIATLQFLDKKMASNAGHFPKPD
jgi:hypothetical protein